uniref:Uncharacterized protein n=1 Tax=Arundo donax TaxID=35708 RepID=A0A0A9HR13_ARUDO
MRLYSASMDKTIRVWNTCSHPFRLIVKIYSIDVEVYVASSDHKFQLMFNIFIVLCQLSLDAILISVTCG